MSRIGRSPISLPSGVEVDFRDQTIVVRGPKGVLERRLPEGISVKKEGEVLRVERAGEERQLKALHGLSRSLVSNMVVGVTAGFVKELEIVGVGYRAAARGDKEIELSLGFSHPVVVAAPPGVSFEVPAPNRIRVAGIDKELVGQVAANIRKIRKPEPYKGKGVRYLGEQVMRKAGKAAK